VLAGCAISLALVAACGVTGRVALAPPPPAPPTPVVEPARVAVPEPAPPEAPQVSPAPPAEPAVVEAPCPPVARERIEPVALDTSVVEAPVPELVDAMGNMGRLRERLASLARGTATDHVRIGVYGDSNMVRDLITGQLRRTLQRRLGDGGHGFVALSRPWGTYRHQDVRHDISTGFRMIATSTHRTGDAYYGFANLASETCEPGHKAWVATAPDTSDVGKTVASFGLFFLHQPRGGRFTVEIDGQPVEEISTKGPWSAGFERLEVPEGPHKLSVRSGTGTVRYYGVALERAAPGIVIDSLGVGALNFAQMARVDGATRRAMLERRGYDAVFFLLGTNMFSPPNHAAWIHDTLEDFRAALPGVTLVLMSPPDIHENASGPDRALGKRTHERIDVIAGQWREIAEAEGIAFWDFREAMGGRGSIRRFAKNKLATVDYIHFTPKGARLMGDRLAFAILRDLAKHLDADPDAGCGPAGEASTPPRQTRDEDP
jgi:lysophospholipase L1-like esterase